MRALAWLCAAACWLCACGGAGASRGDDDDGDDAPSAQPESLEALELFADPVAQEPAASVVPYDVNAVLYADEAEKLRFLAIPEGEQATYDDSAVWQFPDGTRLVKTFFFWNDARDQARGRRLLETRIIECAAGKWSGRTYVWNDAQTEARRLKAGKTLDVAWIDQDGKHRTLDYRVPNDNECKTCHAKKHVFEPLGPRTRQLDRDHDYGSAHHPKPENQIDHLMRAGLLRGDVPRAADRFALLDPYGDDSADTLERRARSYLDANCSHCHRPGGEAGSTALDLRAESEEAFGLGVCRTPVAAGPGSGGHEYDIVPGDPDASILVYRMESTDPEIKMPELPTVTSDAQGVALIREWIAAMPETSDCN
jgi:uncharacterized repeat protein (TIGR03806 family)